MFYIFAVVGLSNSSINSAKRTSSSSGVSSTRSERSSDSSNSTCNDVRPSFRYVFNYATRRVNHITTYPLPYSEHKENHVSFTVNEVKPMLRKKVVIKPTENRAVRLPSKPNPLRIEEKVQVR